MTTNLSQLTDEELLALSTGDLSSISDETLKMLSVSGQPQTPVGEVLKGTEADKPSVGLQRATALTQGASFGFSDELQGIIEGLGAVTEGESFSEGFEEGRDVQRETFDIARQERPIETTALTALGGVPTGGVTSGSTVAGRLASNVGQGAAAGAGFSEADSTQGFVTDVGIGAGIGGTVGLGTELVGKLGRTIAGSFKKVKPKASELIPDVKNVGDILDDVNKVGGVSNILSKQAEESQGIVSNLYNKAEISGKNAFLQNPVTTSLVRQLDEMAETTVNPDSKALLDNAITALRNKNNIGLNEIVRLRNSVSDSFKAGGGTRYTAGNIVRAIDDNLDEASRVGMISGDQSAVRQFNEAISASKEHFSKFAPTNKDGKLTLAGKAIVKAIDDEMTPEEVANAFFGGSGVGNARHAAKTYDAVLRAVPTEMRDEVGRDLKRAIVSRMFRLASSAADNTEVAVSKLGNEIKRLRINNKSLFNKFSDAEKAQLQNLEVNINEMSKGGVINDVLNSIDLFAARNRFLRIPLPSIFRGVQDIPAEQAAGLITATPRQVGQATTAGAVTTPALSTAVLSQERQ